MRTATAFKATAAPAPYRARIKLAGFPRLSANFPTEAEGRAWLASLRAHHAAGTLAEFLHPRKNVRELAEDYLKRELSQRGGSGKASYRAMRHFLRAFGDSMPEEVKRADVRRLRDRRLRTVSGSTWNREVFSFNGLLNWARAEHDIKCDDFDELGARENAPRDRRLHAGEYERLIAAAADVRPWLPAAIDLAIGTAMRRSELTRLRWADVDMASGVAVLRGQTKNGDRDVRIPLGAMALDALKRLRDLPRDDADARVVSIKANAERHVLPVTKPEILRLHFQRACKLAGIEGLRLHDLRAEGISRAFESGLPMNLVRQLSRHKSSAILRYARAGAAEDTAKTFAARGF